MGTRINCFFALLFGEPAQLLKQILYHVGCQVVGTVSTSYDLWAAAVVALDGECHLFTSDLRALITACSVDALSQLWIAHL